MKPQVTIELEEYESLKGKIKSLERITKEGHVEVCITEPVLKYGYDTSEYSPYMTPLGGPKNYSSYYRDQLSYRVWGMQDTIDKIEQQVDLANQPLLKLVEQREKQLVELLAKHASQESTLKALRSRCEDLEKENASLKKPWWRIW